MYKQIHYRFTPEPAICSVTAPSATAACHPLVVPSHSRKSRYQPQLCEDPSRHTAHCSPPGAEGSRVWVGGAPSPQPLFPKLRCTAERLWTSPTLPTQPRSQRFWTTGWGQRQHCHLALKGAQTRQLQPRGRRVNTHCLRGQNLMHRSWGFIYRHTNPTESPNLTFIAQVFTTNTVRAVGAVHVSKLLTAGTKPRNGHYRPCCTRPLSTAPLTAVPPLPQRGWAQGPAARPSLAVHGSSGTHINTAASRGCPVPSHLTATG